MGGLVGGKNTLVLHARLRYFDPLARRAGLPEDVAALIEEMTAERVSVTLVNLNPVSARTVTIQGGAYGEHRFRDVTLEGRTVTIGAPTVTARLAPGSGARLAFRMDRYTAQPALSFPWERDEGIHRPVGLSRP